MSGQEERDTRIGAGHASAMFRQGLAELRGALYNDGRNVAQPTEYGIYGHVTPGEVAKDRAQPELAHSPEQEPERESTVDRHVERATEQAQARSIQPQERGGAER